ncbi:FlgN protein [Natranaerovirga hydrolytica]|uniref:FlgN protein n=1 Tax=Natranaerovirga hydrolytica TaxID=680378 RepID=A0A4R1MLA5_9FIRM|nr:flagellar protein FlgN [Natranaerovirga hydrolytica]TCK93377.1 FlgN protein [Natranaerovirga hydrolytica]
MASLMEEMVNTLSEELNYYKQLLELAKTKTKVIVDNDTEQLQQLTEQEQILASRLLRLEKKREEKIQDIALVINKSPDELTLNNLIALLKGQEKEQDALNAIREDLVGTMAQLKVVNNQNQELINQALDYIDFTINAIRTSKSLPQTASYEGRGTVAEHQTNDNRMFDAKQ